MKFNDIHKLPLSTVQSRLLTLLPFETLAHENKWYFVDLKFRELDLLLDSDQITSKQFNERFDQNAELRKTFCLHSYVTLEYNLGENDISEVIEYLSFDEISIYVYEKCEDCLKDFDAYLKRYRKVD